jgi:hypothetical protein
MLSKDGVLVTGPIREDGSYALTSVPTGTVRVAVNSPPPVEVGAGGPTGPLGKDPASAPPPPADNKSWFPIPEQYGDPEQSGLTCNVKPGANVHNIDLP